MKAIRVILSLLCFVTLASIALESCRKKEVVSAPAIVPFKIPAGFPAPVYSFTENPLTEEGFTLGRRLFHDGILSKDGKYPCASCHMQVASFTTAEHDLSHGYNQSHTTRNAPALSNVAWQPLFNHDGGASSLQSVSLAHINHPQEMGENMEDVVRKLKADASYRQQFLAAYADETINADRTLRALNQYLVQLVSANAKYDRVRRGEDAFNAPEAAGYQVFQSKCAGCHAEPLFTDYSFRNIGLPVNPAHNDYGRMAVTGLSSDSLKFRVPTLRNVQASSFYTHDGRLGSLRTMVNHYRSGMVNSSTVDPLVAGGIDLSDADVDNLLYFLYTLTDSSYLTNPRFKH